MQAPRCELSSLLIKITRAYSNICLKKLSVGRENQSPKQRQARFKMFHDLIKMSEERFSFSPEEQSFISISDDPCSASITPVIRRHDGFVMHPTLSTNKDVPVRG